MSVGREWDDNGMNIYVGQYRDAPGMPWMLFSIKAPSIYDAEAWFVHNVRTTGYFIAEKIPDQLLKEESWRRQGAHHSEVNMTYRRAKACLK